MNQLLAMNPKSITESVCAILALVLTTTTTVASLWGVFTDPGRRIPTIFFGGCLFLICAGASWISKPPNSGIVDQDGQPIPLPGNSRWVLWGTLAIVLIIAGGTEFYLRRTAQVPLATIDGPRFKPLDPNAKYEPWPFKRAPFTENNLKNFIGDSRKYRERLDIDNFEPVHAISNDNAVYLYDSPLGEHCSFEIAKTLYSDWITIKDIVITVHNFEKIPEYGLGGDENLYNNYIVVINLNRRNEPLPWDFHAELLLDDPSSKSVTPWNRKTIRLGDKPQAFLLKLAAKNPGIYTYSAVIIVEDSMKIPVPITLISEKSPRKCMFEGANEP